MGQRPRPKPQNLANKLLAIRRHLGVSQSQMAQLLALEVSYQRISEYENNVREPNLLVLLRYARLAGVAVDVLIDDTLTL